ncbi:MAG: hypothetical protein RLY30_222 [Pseudomonadota bacterium]
MIPRIHCPAAALGLNLLDATASHHLVRVLRLDAGDRVQLFNGRGDEGEGRIVVADSHACQVHLEQLACIQRESPVRTLVLQSLCLADKMDWVVQKATELGSAEVWPIRAARSQLQLEGQRADKRVAHWQRTAEAAAAQCGRNQIPLVRPIMTLQQALEAFRTAPHRPSGWMLDPFATTPLGNAPLAAEVWIAIGPEAGWTDDEEASARQAGFLGLRLGPRVLRTETVAAAILSAIAVRSGEF